uniref:Uncharacterized protein n=1 Tax=Picea glauca TaxID=3330 RepID=A0A117NHS2_PICGL|nr:hypothetical protein ABT39_MTgene4138 [Picea glauca]QHR86016.1 hypothetical protein Q903MT_gene14 [Picea sitchensis]
MRLDVSYVLGLALCMTSCMNLSFISLLDEWKSHRKGTTHQSWILGTDLGTTPRTFSRSLSFNCRIYSL